jgi:putative DNA primase/helicase
MKNSAMAPPGQHREGLNGSAQALQFNSAGDAVLLVEDPRDVVTLDRIVSGAKWGTSAFADLAVLGPEHLTGLFDCRTVFVLLPGEPDRQLQAQARAARDTAKRFGAEDIRVKSWGGWQADRLFERPPEIDTPGMFRLWANSLDDFNLDVPYAGRFSLTDMGNGERLAATFGKDLKYVEGWRKFLVWDGRRWDQSSESAVARMAKQTARNILKEAAEVPDDRERQETVRWAKTSESRDRLSAMVWAVASEDGIPVKPTALNANPWLLCVGNGTVDLRTGRLDRHRRDNLVTTSAPIDYDPAATCPEFDRFLGRIFAENDGLIGYVRRLCGYILTGDVREQVLPILFGTGANGKSTLLNVLLEILGTDLAFKAPANLLMLKRGDAHPTELASLYGKRLAVCVETGENARINEALIKELTGGDPVTARRMREDFWTFAPTHKVMLCTNHRPAVTGTDHAIWRRLQLIPFAVTIPKEEQDRNLSAKLRSELPGILAWCIRGCLEWQAGGLAAPEEVVLATEEYRQDEDVLGSFLAEHCTIHPSLNAKSAPLYSRYVSFTEGSGENPIKQRSFGKALAERGFERYTNNGTYYRGLGLRPDGPDDTGARH